MLIRGPRSVDSPVDSTVVLQNLTVQAGDDPPELRVHYSLAVRRLERLPSFGALNQAVSYVT